MLEILGAIANVAAACSAVLTVLIAVVRLSKLRRLRRKLEDASHATQHAGRALPDLKALMRGWAVEIAGRLVHPTFSVLSAWIVAYVVVVALFAVALQYGLWSRTGDPAIRVVLEEWALSIFALIVASGPSSLLLSISVDLAKRASWFAGAGQRKPAEDDLSTARAAAFVADFSLFAPAVALLFFLARIVDALPISLSPSSMWVALSLIAAISIAACVAGAVWLDRRGRQYRADAALAIKRLPKTIASEPTESPAGRSFGAVILVLGAVAAGAGWASLKRRRNRRS